MGKYDALRFTKAEVAALSVPDGIVLRLTDDLPDLADEWRGRLSELPSPFGPEPDEGAAIAVWQMLFPEDRTKRVGTDAVFTPVPKWLWAQGISYHRGWVTHALDDDWAYLLGDDDSPVGIDPDFVWLQVRGINDGGYAVVPVPAPRHVGLQAFVTAVANISRNMLLDVLKGWFGPGGILTDRIKGGRA